MNGFLLAVIVTPVRAILRWLQCRNERVPAWRKAVLVVLVVPIFGIIVATLNVWLRLTGRSVVVETTTPTGDRFRCHLPDLIQMYLHVFGVWEPDLTAYLERALAPGDAMIDVGANVGYFSLVALRRVGADGCVASIEASPRIVRQLETTMTLNGAPANVRIVPRAASDAAGTLSIYAGPAHNLGLTTSVATRGMTAEAEVPTDTLDALLTDDEIARARIVKIDVEGGEPAVIAGMAGFLARSRDDVEILLEVSPEWWAERDRRPDEVLRPLLDAGFHAYELPNSYWPWRYLWPRDVRPPVRVTRPLTARVKRLDLVLSRRDVANL